MAIINNFPGGGGVKLPDGVFVVAPTTRYATVSETCSTAPPYGGTVTSAGATFTHNRAGSTTIEMSFTASEVSLFSQLYFAFDGNVKFWNKSTSDWVHIAKGKIVHFYCTGSGTSKSLYIMDGETTLGLAATGNLASPSVFSFTIE